MICLTATFEATEPREQPAAWLAASEQVGQVLPVLACRTRERFDQADGQDKSLCTVGVPKCALTLGRAARERTVQVLLEELWDVLPQGADGVAHIGVEVRVLVGPIPLRP